MNVVIAGGHGKVALRLTRRLHDRGDTVRSLIRKPAHAGDVEAAGGRPVVCDLELVSEDELARVIAGADAAMFAAGAGSGSGPDRKWTMDYGGAVKLIEAAKLLGIARYVIVSSMGADPDAEGDDFAVYQRAKGRADAALQESGLAYTVIRPTRLTDEPGTGKVHIGEGLQRSEVSRDDVAAVIAASLHSADAIGKTFELTAGETTIDDALAQL